MELASEWCANYQGPRSRAEPLAGRRHGPVFGASGWALFWARFSAPELADKSVRADCRPSPFCPPILGPECGPKSGPAFGARKYLGLEPLWWSCNGPRLRVWPTCLGDFCDGPRGACGLLSIRAAKQVSCRTRPPPVPGEMHARLLVERIRSGGPGPRCMCQAYRAGKRIVCVSRGGFLGEVYSRGRCCHTGWPENQAGGVICRRH